jgi:hypothetical protein
MRRPLWRGGSARLNGSYGRTVAVLGSGLEPKLGPESHGGLASLWLL